MLVKEMSSHRKTFCQESHGAQINTNGIFKRSFQPNDLTEQLKKNHQEITPRFAEFFKNFNPNFSKNFYARNV